MLYAALLFPLLAIPALLALERLERWTIGPDKTRHQRRTE